MDHDGRYEGSNGEYSLILRVDVGGSAVISADLFSGTEYLTSVRTAPGTLVESATGSWAAEFSGVQSTTGDGAGTGSIALTPGAGTPASVTARIRSDADLAGLPAGTELAVTVEQVGAEVRELGLEVETEEGIEPPKPYDFAGASIDQQECLRRAGFAVSAVGDQSVIPRQAQPWDFSRMHTLLHDVMTASAQTNLSAAAWQLQLLLLSACTNTGLAGVMFDPAGVLPRQGCAAFLHTIRRYAAHFDEDPDRNAIRTIVHEIGHGLNLAHRFQAGLDRPDSTSFMNYPGKYQPDAACGYWRDFTFTFDPDELEFLRHAPLGAVRPGGAPFLSVAYWYGHSFLPPVLRPPSSRLRLSLKAPPAGTTFTVGQPVFLEVVLENIGDTPVSFAFDPLDLKTGPLRLFVRPKPAEGAEPDEFQLFVPPVMGCGEPVEPVTLPAHDLLSNNLNIGFGAGGSHAFPEPGEYQLAVGLSLAEPWGPVYSRLLEIDVVADSDREAAILLRPDVGAWFALGGSDALADAGESLAELRAERQARRGAADPVVAAIVRAAGINAGRPTTRFQAGRFVERAGDPVRAEELLGSLDAAALRCFDPHTAAGTARLAGRYAAVNRGETGA